jgi:hypothetical protein
MKLKDIFIVEDMHRDLDPRNFNPNGRQVEKVYSWKEFEKTLPEITNGVEHKESRTGGTVSIAYAKNPKTHMSVITGVFRHVDNYGEVLV